MDVAKILWDDREFIKKRVDEQISYVWDLHNREDMDDARRVELLNPAVDVYSRFKERLRELDEASSNR